MVDAANRNKWEDVQQVSNIGWLRGPLGGKEAALDDLFLSMYFLGLTGLRPSYEGG